MQLVVELKIGATMSQSWYNLVNYKTEKAPSVVIPIIINPTSKIDQSPKKMSGENFKILFYKNNFIYRTELVALLNSVTFLTCN